MDGILWSYNATIEENADIVLAALDGVHLPFICCTCTDSAILVYAYLFGLPKVSKHALALLHPRVCTLSAVSRIALTMIWNLFVGVTAWYKRLHRYRYRYRYR